jgi:hypothetical protein
MSSLWRANCLSDSGHQLAYYSLVKNDNRPAADFTDTSSTAPSVVMAWILLAKDGSYKLQSTRPNLQRRSFLKQTLMIAGMTSISSTVFATSDELSMAELSILSKKLASMPKDFTGISFEEPQLYNPAYFSAANVSLVEAYTNWYKSLISDGEVQHEFIAEVQKGAETILPSSAAML